MKTITRDKSVGIWDNCTDVARVYDERTVATIEGVRWIGNSGNLHEYKYRITGKAHEQILAALEDGCDETAWAIIYGYDEDDQPIERGIK